MVGRIRRAPGPEILSPVIDRGTQDGPKALHGFHAVLAAGG